MFMKQFEVKGAGGRLRKLRFLRFGVLMFVCLVLAAALFAQIPQPEPYTFLRKQLAFSPAELMTLENRKIIVRLPKTSETT